MREKKIIIIGAYGCGNKGDDAILEGILSALGTECNVTVTEGKYGGIREKFHVKTLRCRMNEGVNLQVIGNLFVFLFRYFVRCINSSCVLIGGGSLLHDITKYNLRFFSLLQKTAEILGKKVIYLGVGAGPITTASGKRLCRKIIGHAEKVFVRDVPDYQLLKETGLNNIELVADMAFSVETDKKLAESILKNQGIKRKQYIAVTACEWFESVNFWNKDKMDFTEEIRKIAEVLNKLHSITGLPLLFLPTVTHDIKLGKQLQTLLPVESLIVISEHYDCSQMAALVAESKFLYGIRMHSIIFSIRAGVPFMASVYDRKVFSLMKRCDMTDYLFDLKKGNINEIDSIVDKIMNNETQISKHLREKAEMLKTQSQIALKYIREI